MTLAGFQGDVAVDGSLMLVGAYEDWARLLAALDGTGSVEVSVAPLPATATTQPLTKLVLACADRPGDSRSAGNATAGGVLDGGLAMIVAFDGFAKFSDRLRDILEFNDASDLESRGWHAHFDLDPAAELPAKLQGLRLSEIMLSGPNWQ